MARIRIGRPIALIGGLGVALLALVLWMLRPLPPSPSISTPICETDPIERSTVSSRRFLEPADPASGDLPEDAPLPPPPDDAPRPFRTAETRLPNGLTLVLVEDRSAPTIAAHVAFGVGSASDPEDLPGLAHFVEHLMFSKTSRLGTVVDER